MAPADQMTTLLLVGRSGNGKSSVEKSILQVNPTLIPDLHVVRCCSVGDTGDDVQCDYLSDFAHVVKCCKLYGGIDAIVLVLKYGTRFTKQEKDAFAMVRSVFGADALSSYGIVLMTNGDLFELDREESSLSFKEWCDTQTGDIRELFREVSNRIVLFDNRTKEKKNQQFESLMECVNQIKSTANFCKYGNLKEAKRRHSVVMTTGTINRNRRVPDADSNFNRKEEVTITRWIVIQCSTIRAPLYYVYRWISSKAKQFWQNGVQRLQRSVQRLRKFADRRNPYQRVNHTDLDNSNILINE